MSRRVILVAIAVLATGCASTGARPRPFPVPGGPPAGATPPAAIPSGPPERTDLDGYAVSSTALALRGAPYQNGGDSPAGFDCSGFVRYVFARHGVSLPRDVRGQFDAGHQVAVEAVSPGDLVFFSTVSAGASHVGIAIGGDQFVHAPSSNGVVRVERFTSRYWSDRFVGARRPR